MRAHVCSWVPLTMPVVFHVWLHSLHSLHSLLSDVFYRCFCVLQREELQKLVYLSLLH